MSREQKINDFIDAITPEDLDDFIRANPRFFDQRGMLLRDIVVADKFVMKPGGSTRGLRTIPITAYLGRLFMRTGEDRLAGVLRRSLFPPRESAVRDAVLRNVGALERSSGVVDIDKAFMENLNQLDLVIQAGPSDDEIQNIREALENVDSKDPEVLRKVEELKSKVESLRVVDIEMLRGEEEALFDDRNAERIRTGIEMLRGEEEEQLRRAEALFDDNLNLLEERVQGIRQNPVASRMVSNDFIDSLGELIDEFEDQAKRAKFDLTRIEKIRTDVRSLRENREQLLMEDQDFRPTEEELDVSQELFDLQLDLPPVPMVEESADISEAGRAAMRRRLIPEPVVQTDTRTFFDRDGRAIDMTDDSLEGRLRQIEYFAGVAEDNLDIPVEIRENARVVIDTIREGVQSQEESSSTFRKVLNFGKTILGGMAVLPILPPHIRAGAAGVLVGVEAIEATVQLLSGDASGTDAIRAGVRLANELVPGAEEVGELLLDGLDAVDAVSEIRTQIRTAVRAEEEFPQITLTRILDPVEVNASSNPETEIVLSGISSDNEWYEPIHADALAVFFASANLPQWNKGLLIGRNDRFKVLPKEDYVPYLQQQTRLLWEKHSVDMLVPELIYTKPDDDFDLIIKENLEILQLYNVIVGVRANMDIINNMNQILAKVDLMTSNDEEHGREKGHNFNKDVKVNTDTSIQNEEGQKHSSSVESLAVIDTREGKPSVQDREILSLGWSASGRRIGGLIRTAESYESGVKLPAFTNETRKFSEINNIRTK